MWYIFISIVLLILIGAIILIYALRTAKPDPQERPDELTEAERRQLPKQ